MSCRNFKYLLIASFISLLSTVFLCIIMQHALDVETNYRFRRIRDVSTNSDSGSNPVGASLMNKILALFTFLKRMSVSVPPQRKKLLNKESGEKKEKKNTKNHKTGKSKKNGKKKSEEKGKVSESNPKRTGSQQNRKTKTGVNLFTRLNLSKLETQTQGNNNLKVKSSEKKNRNPELKLKPVQTKSTETLPKRTGKLNVEVPLSKTKNTLGKEAPKDRLKLKPQPKIKIIPENVFNMKLDLPAKKKKVNPIRKMDLKLDLTSGNKKLPKGRHFKIIKPKKSVPDL